MRIFFRCSMSIIEKVFHYEENEISVIKCRDDIWFKAKQAAILLGYLDPGRSIRRNVDPEDKITLERLIKKGGAKSASPLVSNCQRSTLYLNVFIVLSLDQSVNWLNPLNDGQPMMYYHLLERLVGMIIV